MSRKKQGTIVTTSLLLAAVLISACQQPYSTPPAATNTPLDTNSLFSTPMSEPDSMQDVQNFITQTALAGNPGAVISTATPGATGAVPTITATPIINLNPTATQAVAAATTVAAPAVSGSEWVLKNGEFPYCIARRYNVDPSALINASRLSSPDIYYEGQKMIIPDPKIYPWPSSLGPRGLGIRPGTYTVTGNSDLTIYGVACKYGDINPATIAQNNNLSVDAALTVGQTLNIPSN